MNQEGRLCDLHRLIYLYMNAMYSNPFYFSVFRKQPPMKSLYHFVAITILVQLPAILLGVELSVVPFPVMDAQGVSVGEHGVLEQTIEMDATLLNSRLHLGEFPEFGRLVPGAGGELLFAKESEDGFMVRVILSELLPHHSYILTLNGNPERKGNSLLPKPVPGNEEEHYYDFQTIQTDADGAFEHSFAIRLPKGIYEIRFYVKDTEDFKIVLYHDFFPLSVIGDGNSSQ